MNEINMFNISPSILIKLTDYDLMNGFDLIKFRLKRENLKEEEIPTIPSAKREFKLVYDRPNYFNYGPAGVQTYPMFSIKEINAIQRNLVNKKIN